MIVIGGLFALAALAGLAAGGTALVLDRTQRDASGYLMTDFESYRTGTYGFVAGTYHGGTADDLFVAAELLGEVRMRVKSEWPVFVGIAKPAALNSYFADVRHETTSSFDAGRSDFRVVGRRAPHDVPGNQAFWVAQTSGAGEQILQWTPQSGDWSVVVMNADGSPGVKTEVSIGARVPHLLWIGLAIVGGAVVALILGIALIYGGARERSTS